MVDPSSEAVDSILAEFTHNYQLRDTGYIYGPHILQKLRKIQTNLFQYAIAEIKIKHFDQEDKNSFTPNLCTLILTL